MYFQKREPGAIASALLKLFAVSTVILFSTGCKITEGNLITPARNVPASFSQSGNIHPPCHWWKAFGDQQLNSLIDEAFQNELTLQSVWQRLQAARAVVTRESSFLIPEVDGVFEGTNRDSRSSNESPLELGLVSNYEVDLWGRIRSSVDAEQFRAEASEADYQTVALSLSAEVAVAWFQLLESLARRDLLLRQIQTNEKLTLQLRNQFGGGQVRAVDVLRQEQLVAATRQQTAAEEATIGVLENRLSILLGRPAQKGFTYRKAYPGSLPPLPDTGIPAELVCRRPDVQAAYLRLQAANKDVAVAISDRFPRLSLSASVSSTNRGAEDLFDDWMRNLVGNLVAPLIDGGRRKAEIQRARAVECQLCYEYGQTVLVAFQEVEDALILEEKQKEQITQLQEQVRLAEKTYNQLLVEYTNGVSDFIDLLTSLTDVQRLRRDLLLANRLLLEYRVALYRALSGGFDESICLKPPSGLDKPKHR